MGVNYYEQHHYHYPYTRRTNNNVFEEGFIRNLEYLTIQPRVAINEMQGPTITPCSLTTSIP
jgi:hypothetical protein